MGIVCATAERREKPIARHGVCVSGKVEYGKPVSFPNVPAVPAKAEVEVRCTGRIEMKKQ